MKPPFAPMDESAEAARREELELQKAVIEGKGKAKGLGVPAADIPAPPDEFRPSEFSDPAGPLVRGLAMLKAAGVDTSGPDKAYRAVRVAAWEVHVRGASVRGWRDDLLRAKTSAGAVPSEKQAAEISRLQAIIAAAESWPGQHTATIRAAHDAAVLRHEEMTARLKPYLTATLPPPPGWEESVFEAEREVSRTGAAWIEARAAFDAIGERLQKATSAAYSALASALGNLCSALGVRARSTVKASDIAFLLRFPARAPDELAEIFASAERVSALMDGLDRAAVDHGLARFVAASGGEVAEIVEAKIAAGRGGRVLHDAERTAREQSPHPDAAMREVY